MKTLLKLLGSLFFIAIIVAVIAAVIGWIINFVEVVTYGGGITETAEGILMIVGIFIAPLGAIMGLFV